MKDKLYDTLPRPRKPYAFYESQFCISEYPIFETENSRNISTQTDEINQEINQELTTEIFDNSTSQIEIKVQLFRETIENRKLLHNLPINVCENTNCFKQRKIKYIIKENGLNIYERKAYLHRNEFRYYGANHTVLKLFKF